MLPGQTDKAICDNMLMIQKLLGHLFESLMRTVSAGNGTKRHTVVSWVYKMNINSNVNKL